MSNTPFRRFAEDELTLRDYLAIDRTILANERTLLAHARTSICLLAGGVTAIQLLEETYAAALGVAAIIAAVAVAVLGLFSYQRGRRHYKGVLETEGEK